MDRWVSQSSPVKQTVLAAVCAVAGLALMYGFRDFGAVRSDAFAGFLLGVLLLVIAIAGFLMSGRQTVTVDSATRLITVEDSTYVRHKERLIPFDDITHVGIGFLGKRSNFVTWYYVALKLSSGEEYPLFAPGRFFAGGSDRATVVGWQRRLERCLSGSASPADDRHWDTTSAPPPLS